MTLGQPGEGPLGGTMLYHSIRLGISYVLLAAVMVALPVHAQLEQKAETPEPAKTTEPAAESLAACKQELQRIGREALKGADARFSSTDERTLETCGAAQAALKANRFASHPSPEVKKRIKPELIERAKESSARMVAEFRENGINASFSSSDRDNVRIFVGVAAAVTVLQLADSPTATKDIDPEVVEDAKKSAAAMISKLNEGGYGAFLFPWDLEPLERFLSKVEEKKR